MQVGQSLIENLWKSAELKIVLSSSPICSFLIRVLLNHAPTSTQLHPPPPSSFQPPPSSLQHPQQYLNQNIPRYWAISPNLGRKYKSCPFWMKISTHDILEVFIPNPDLDFWNPDPKIHFWANLGPKFQSWERYDGGFWDSGTFSCFWVSFQRSSRTPLCHFDKLEAHQWAAWGQSCWHRYKTLLEDFTLSFWQTRGTARAGFGQRYFPRFRVSFQCSSRTLQKYHFNEVFPASGYLRSASRTQKKYHFNEVLLAISSTCAGSRSNVRSKGEWGGL